MHISREQNEAAVNTAVDQATASWGAHSWKRTPKLKEIKVEYERPTRTLFHEDR